MTRKEVVEQDGFIVETTWKDALTTVVFSDGKTFGKGNAKWYTSDPYDENLGKSLAFTRAVARWARKAEKQLIRSLG